MELRVSTLNHSNSPIGASTRSSLRTDFLTSRTVNWNECAKDRLHGPRSNCSEKVRRLSVASAAIVTTGEGSHGGLLPEKKTVPVNPVYTPTPVRRELRTPHSGYHFDGTTRKFFEGWYFKVSIPERRQSFCFMYSVENPAFRKKLSTVEQVAHGPRFTGVGAQILGADDKYIFQFSEESKNFWGSRHELKLGNTFTAGNKSSPPNREVPPQDGTGAGVGERQRGIYMEYTKQVAYSPKAPIFLAKTRFFINSNCSTYVSESIPII